MIVFNLSKEVESCTFSLSISVAFSNFPDAISNEARDYLTPAELLQYAKVG